MSKEGCLRFVILREAAAIEPSTGIPYLDLSYQCNFLVSGSPGLSIHNDLRNL